MKYIPRPTRSTILACALAKVVTGASGMLSHCLLCDIFKTISSEAPVKEGFTRNLSIKKYCSLKGKLDCANADNENKLKAIVNNIFCFFILVVLIYSAKNLLLSIKTPGKSPG